jgi:hypothetical protein
MLLEGERLAGVNSKALEVRSIQSITPKLPAEAKRYLMELALVVYSTATTNDPEVAEVGLELIRRSPNEISRMAHSAE